MIKNIIFDLGGVILNIDFQRAADAFKNLGLANFEELYSQAVQSDLFTRLETGRITPDTFRKELRQLANIPMTDSQIDEAWNALILDFPPARLQLLRDLSNKYRLFLLSNTNIIHAEFYNEDLRNNHNIDGLESLFEKVYYSHEIGLRKPDKASYRKVIEENNLKATETLFIDDSYPNIKAAISVGLKPIFINKEKSHELTQFFANGVMKQRNDIVYDYEQTLCQNFFDEERSGKYDSDIAPIIIALDLRTPMNIGGLIRLAGNIGCQKVIFTGDETRFRKDKIKRAATTGFGHVNWEFCDHHQWKDRIPEDYQIVAVETVENATSIFETELKGKIALVVGNERYGIDDQSMKLCDSAVYIPMPGIVKSMNVVQATNVVIFEWLRQNIK